MKEIFEQFINERVFIETTDNFLYHKGQFKITSAYDKFLEIKQYNENYAKHNYYIPYTSIFYITTDEPSFIIIRLIDTINIGDESFQHTIDNIQNNLNSIRSFDLDIKMDIENIKKMSKL